MRRNIANDIYELHIGFTFLCYHGSITISRTLIDYSMVIVYLIMSITTILIIVLISFLCIAKKKKKNNAQIWISTSYNTLYSRKRTYIPKAVYWVEHGKLKFIN